MATRETFAAGTDAPPGVLGRAGGAGPAGADHAPTGGDANAPGRPWPDAHLYRQQAVLQGKIADSFRTERRVIRVIEQRFGLRYDVQVWTPPGFVMDVLLPDLGPVGADGLPPGVAIECDGCEVHHHDDPACPYAGYEADPAVRTPALAAEIEQEHARMRRRDARILRRTGIRTVRVWTCRLQTDEQAHATLRAALAPYLPWLRDTPEDTDHDPR